MFSSPSSTLTAAFQAPILSERNDNKIRRRRRYRRFCCAGRQNQKSNNFNQTKSASNGEKRYLTKKDDSVQTHENESTTSLNRAISIASQSMCCIASTTGGFSNFELVARWFDLDTTTTTTTNNNNNNEEDKDMNNKMGKLNERLMWKEEDTYERQMRLATASFLAATTVAVGQPALALDFVLVDPSGAFRFVKISYPLTFRFFSLASAYIYYIRMNTHQRYSDTHDDGLHTCSQRIHGPTRRGHVFQVQRRHDGLRR